MATISESQIVLDTNEKLFVTIEGYEMNENSVNQTSSNKRIAKNTLLLYFCTILIMSISLYTSRVILNVLGVNDFGLYNVVGGIVEAVLKLAVAYLLLYSAFDKLIVYAVLIFIVALIVRIIYSLYCLRHFAKCRGYRFQIYPPIEKYAGVFRLELYRSFLCRFEISGDQYST